MDSSALSVVALIVIAAAGGFALSFSFVMVLKRIRISTITIRAVGIVVVVIAVCALAISAQLDSTAAVGVLGAVAGYLFGAGSSGDSSAVSAGDVGDGNTIVGRDLNQRVDELKAETVHLSQAVSSLSRVAANRESTSIHIVELVTPKVARFGSAEFAAEFADVVSSRQGNGQHLVTTTGPYDSRQDDFTSTILVFASDGPPGTNHETIYRLGANPPFNSDRRPIGR